MIDTTHAEIKSGKMSNVLVLYYLEVFRNNYFSDCVVKDVFAKKNVTRNMAKGVVIHLLGTVPF